MWLGLLAALVYTSEYGASLRDVFNYFSFATIGGTSRIDNTLTTFVTLVLRGVLAFQLIRAWLRFATFTINLLIAYSKYDPLDNERNVFAQMLTFSRPDSTVPNSYITDVLRPVAYAWAIIVVTPYLPYIVVSLTRTQSI
jgi:hypothetical protein